MVRSFTPAPIERALLEELLNDSLRAPSAGNSRGVAWHVLCGPTQCARYWETVTDEEWRERSPRYPRLKESPVIALSLASPDVYLERYSEKDKSASGLGTKNRGGGGEEAWPVPYWYGDAAFATMTLLYGAHNAGLGACFLGAFRHSEELLRALSIDGSWRLFGAVLLGMPGKGDHRSKSLDRQVERPRIFWTTL